MTDLDCGSVPSSVMLVRVYLVFLLFIAITATAASENIAKHTQHRNKRQTSEKLCPPLRSLNAIATCFLRDKDVECNGNIKPGTIAKVKCKRYYKPSVKPDYTRLKCLENGNWDHSLFNCTPECGSSNLDHVTDRIIDGKEAKPGSFPWHAGLYYRKTINEAVIWDQKCSGSLLTDQFVITAAHCVADTVEIDLRVGLGKYFRDWEKPEKGEAKRSVSKIIYQHDFSKNVLTFDIALLRLDEKVEFGETIMPVCRGFPDTSTYLKNKDLYVVGWGLTKAGDMTSASDILLYNSVTVVNEVVCRTNIPSVYTTFDKFCAVKEGRSDVSIVQKGDSGGGITSVYDGLHVIFGAVSAKDKQYSMFTNFTWPYNVIWIESELRKYDSSFRWDENDITELQSSDRGCLLPEASSSRKFCSLSPGCEDCDIHDRLCFIPPGSKVDRVRVVCAPGFTIRSPYSGGDVAICLNGRSWYPEIPECYRYQYIPGNPMTKVTWQEARDHCANNGHVLATIKKEEEAENFKQAVVKYFDTTGIPRSGVWIGLSDLKFDKTFEWVDGSILSKSDYTKWQPGEPSENAHGSTPYFYQEHCVEAKGCGGEECTRWNDMYCSNLLYYFCKEVVPPDGVFDRIAVSEIVGDTASKPIPRYTYLPGNPWKKVTWDEARDNCMAKGSQLAIIRAPDQQKLFEETVDKHFKDTDTQPSSIWIGLRLVLKEYTRTFTWTDGSTYNAWMPGSWANWMPKSSNWNWDCTEAAAGDTLKLWPYAYIYEWNDVNCTDLNYYFCSIKL